MSMAKFRTYVVGLRIYRTLAFVILLAALPGGQVHAEERTWTSDDGKKIVGELLRQDGDAVVLKVGTKEFSVPLARLSVEDRNWLDARKKELDEMNKGAAALGGSLKSFPKNDKQAVGFHVYYPTSYSVDKPRPLIILFSASGQGKSILEAFKASCESLGWVGVGCDTFRNGVNDDELDPLFKELLPVIEASVIHDPQRLHTGGISGGASRALQYTAKFDRPWKGVISCGGWLGKQFDLEYRKDMAVAWVNGDTDKGANFWIEQDSKALKNRRCKTKLFAFPGGHVIGPPEVLTEAMRWVEEHAGGED